MLVLFCCAVFWLLLASTAGLTASIKLHEPDWLTQQAWLTFGRIRTLHLNAVAYGWAPMAGLGIAMFILPRVLKTLPPEIADYKGLTRNRPIMIDWLAQYDDGAPTSAGIHPD